jgi:hypothetical protein
MFSPRVILTALAIPALGGTVQAHPNQQNAMWIQFEPSRAHLAVDVSLQELCAVWEISNEQKTATEPSALLWAAQQHQGYIIEHLKISTGPTRLSGTVLKISPPAVMGDPERTFFQYELEYLFDGPPPKEIRVSHDMLHERPYSAGVPWDISYIVSTKRSDQEMVTSWLLRGGTPLEVATGWSASPPPASPAAREDDSRQIDSAWAKMLETLKRLLGL